VLPRIVHARVTFFVKNDRDENRPMNPDMSNFQAVVASLTVEGEACDLTQPKLLLGIGTEKEIAPFIHKVGATSIAEIDRLIAELRQTKEYLQSRRQRVEAEMLRYTNLAEMASATAKIISDAVSQWYPARLSRESRAPDVSASSTKPTRLFWETRPPPST
jgi:hypothetical protein